MTAALAIIATSATAVWWLRREPARIATSSAEHPADDTAGGSAGRGAAGVVQTAAAASHDGAPQRPRAVRRASVSAPTVVPAVPRADAAPRGAAAAPNRAGDAPRAAPADASSAPPLDQAAQAEEHEKQEVGRIANEVIAGMRAAGEKTGLAAIPPPGTNPVKSGLVVPKDFPLPEGYVRHYQMTDDGRRLEAILMFSPDYTFVDEAGNPIAIPEDGIVPPDMAPPGLPLRTLEVPGAARPKAAAPDLGE